MPQKRLTAAMVERISPPAKGQAENWHKGREVDRLRGQRQVRPYRGPIKLEPIEYATVAELVDAAIAYSTARDEPWPEAQAGADEMVAAHDAYMAEWKRPDEGCEPLRRWRPRSTPTTTNCVP